MSISYVLSIVIWRRAFRFFIVLIRVLIPYAIPQEGQIKFIHFGSSSSLFSMVYKRKPCANKCYAWRLNFNLNCCTTILTVRGYCFRLVSDNCNIMMTQSSLHRPIGKGIIFGAIGGFVGGLFWYFFLWGNCLMLLNKFHK